MKWIKLFEDFDINESFNKDIYEHGRCELFALALHEELGYDMYFYLDEEGEIEDEEGEITEDSVLIHAYAKDNKGNMFDVNGLIEESDLDEHVESVNKPKTIKVTKKQFVNFHKKNKYVGKYTEKSILECRKYIKVNIDKFIIH